MKPGAHCRKDIYLFIERSTGKTLDARQKRQLRKLLLRNARLYNTFLRSRLHALSTELAFFEEFRDELENELNESANES